MENHNMKTKKLSKKLKLNKETISNLNSSELGKAKGGATYKCPTDYLICDSYADCTYTEHIACTEMSCYGCPPDTYALDCTDYTCHNTLCC